MCVVLTEKVQNHYDNLLSDRETVQINQTMRRTMNSFNYVVTKINRASESIGKDGRFQIFVCIGVRSVCKLNLSETQTFLLASKKIIPIELW